MQKMASKRNIRIIYIMLFLVFILLCVNTQVFATDVETKVIVKSNIDTTVVLTHEITGEYVGILRADEDLIFKNLGYGTYTVSCINQLDVSFNGTNNQFTLSAENAMIEVILKNERIVKSGFYSVETKDNIFKVDMTPPVITGENLTVKIGDDNQDLIYKDLTAKDVFGTDLTASMTTEDFLDPSLVGTHSITYKVKGAYTEGTFTRTITIVGTYDYTGDYQKFVAQSSGTYIFELWGASRKGREFRSLSTWVR